MKTGHQRIAIDLIEMNTGQIAGLPSNPRQWTKAQLDKLKASIEETPELLEARGCKDGDTVSIYDFEFDFVN